MDGPILAKPCTKCGVVKPLTDFHSSPRMKDGRKNQCKECVNEKMRAGPRIPGQPPKVQAAILRALRQNGLRFEQLQAGVGEHKAAALKALLAKGQVRQDADGFYELTESGKAVAPYRNPAFAKRFQAGTPPSVKASLDPPESVKEAP